MFSAAVLTLSLSFIGSINIIYCTSSENATSAASTQQTSCQADSKSCAEGSSPHSLYTENPVLAVEMYGEEYRLDTLPAPESSAVTESKQHLLGSIDLMALMNDFGRLGSFIRIAYNGVGAAGPKFTEIQIEIQDIGYRVTKLFDSSALTVSRFEIASKTVLNDLQSTYDYLLDNLEELALETLSSVSKIAEDMVKAAQKLHDEVLVEETRVEATLKNTQRAKGDQALLMQEKAREREELKLKAEQQQQHLKEAQELENQAKEKVLECEEREEEALEESKGFGSILKTLANSVTSMVGLTLFDDPKGEKTVEFWKQKLEEAKKVQEEYRKQRLAAIDKMTEFAVKLKNCESEENMAEIAEEALHKAIGALKEISTILMQVIQFWEQMKQHCELLASDDMLNKVQFAIDHYSEDKRLKVWTSTGFKRKAVFFYAQWVALNSVCKEYMKQIKITQRDLYNYLRENPSYEECRQNVKDLANKFLSDLERDKRAIAERE